MICSEPCLAHDTDVVVLREKGSKGFNNASTELGDDIVAVPGQKVQKECRKSYCKQKNIDRTNNLRKNQTSSSPIRHLTLVRTAEKSFNFQTDCLYCGTEVLFHAKKWGIESYRVTIIIIIFIIIIMFYVKSKGVRLDTPECTK